MNRIKEVLEEKRLKQTWLAENLGKNFVESQPFDLAQPFAAADPFTPIIFVLSSGADPSPYLYKLARDLGFYEKLSVISLGQGQGPKAEALIEAAVKEALVNLSLLPNMDIDAAKVVQQLANSLQVQIILQITRMLDT